MWTPNNQVLLTVADSNLEFPTTKDDGSKVYAGTIRGTEKRITLENVSEPDATFQNVKSLLAEQGLDVQIKFNID